MENVRQAHAAMCMLAAAAGLLIACGARDKSSNGELDTAKPPLAASLRSLPPIPRIDSLARPKALDQIGVPLALTRAAIPADNPQTPEKIALGEKLFFDGRLSANGTVACATCHNPRLAFTDGKPVSVGIRNGLGQRNAPTVLNALYNKFQFWDGRAPTLETQAAFPIINPVEMGQANLDSAVAHVAAVSEYRVAFQRVFGRAPNAANLVRAIASYERSQLSFDAPFDRFMAGDSTAIDAAAKRGWGLFRTKARCNKCHLATDTTSRPARFTDDTFHNIGVGIQRHQVVPLARVAERTMPKGGMLAIDQAAILTPMSVLGRYLITRNDSDIASFKSPDLRNVIVTAPYFHDGSAATLWDVVDHYNKGAGTGDPWLDPDIQPLALHEGEIDDLVAFMASLTSPSYRELAATELVRQRQISRTTRPQRDSARAFAPKVVQPKPPAK
ncbi:MAG TPA: cytochrome c peroxidase [Gemmatimonadaceae bacterium]|nr:cytochrome c peroxidase [Gemmatimonadaceae bacterium]